MIVAIVLPFIPGVDRRIVDLAILMLTYIMLGWGLNIVVGLAGLLDLGYVAFYAVGAYSYALLSTVYLPAWFGDGIVPWAFFITLPIAGILAALWGVILGFPVLRLRGDYLAIVTLAFGEIVRVILINWSDFTGGPAGIGNIPRPSFFGLPFIEGEDGFAAYFRAGLQAHPPHHLPLLRHPGARSHHQFRDDAPAPAAGRTRLGGTARRRDRLPLARHQHHQHQAHGLRHWRHVRRLCRQLLCHTTGLRLPESFVFMESAIVLAIVVLGGLGSQIGVVIAAIVIIGAFELFRELNFLKAVMPAGFDPVQYRMLAVGVAMVLIMRWRPRGFVTRREPSVFLKEKKAIPTDLVAQGHG